MKLKVVELEEILNQIFTSNGLDAKEAKIMSWSILDAEMKGKKHHGLAMISSYVNKINQNRNKPVVYSDMGAYCLMDGGDNLGPLAAHYASDEAMDRAEKHGIGLVGISNKNPFGLAGTVGEYISNQGYASIVMCNSRARIAPIGSFEPIFGTNPISFSFPLQNDSYSIDFSTSAISMAEIRALLQLNKELPLNKAIDNNGMPTTDPQQALDGCVLPFDDYKGYALALAIEIIAGPLINAKAGKSVKGNRGFFIMAIKFQSDEFKMKFQKNVMTLFDEIENSKKMKSIDKIRIPGMQSLKNFKSAQNYGIEVDERIYNYLHKMVKS